MACGWGSDAYVHGQGVDSTKLLRSAQHPDLVGVGGLLHGFLKVWTIDSGSPKPWEGEMGEDRQYDREGVKWEK